MTKPDRTETPPAIELTDLGRTFTTRTSGHHETVTAVERVDLTIGRGEIVALLGPNGAGKTTTLDIVLGLIEPTRGTARVLGLHPREAVQRGLVSAVLQTGGLLADLTVTETIHYIAATYGRRADDVSALLERVGLGGEAHRRVSKCSGGQQQRLRFALALLADPQVLILDEPTAGMDVAGRREFWATMHAEAAKGRTIVFATHYLEEADDFAERIVLVAEGKVVADGSAAEVRAMATGRVVHADVPDVGVARLALEEIGAHVEVQGQHVTARAADSDAVARLILDLGGRDLEIATGSLEDAFVRITGPGQETDTTDETVGVNS